MGVNPKFGINGGYKIMQKQMVDDDAPRATIFPNDVEEFMKQLQPQSNEETSKGGRPFD